MARILSTLFYFLVTLTCVLSSHCTRPSVRREWAKLSEGERADWMNAVKCLGKLPHTEALKPTVDPSISLIPPVDPASTYYDDLVYIHMDLNVKIHHTGQFLPWHRAYTHAFETALKDKCNYTGTQPYWDWRINSDNYFNDFVFSSSSTSGFGGNGDPNNDYQITDGALAEGFKRFYPVPNNIRRNFTQFPFDPAVPANYSFNATAIETLVSGHVGDFVSFQDYFENHAGAHGAIHVSINGDMSGTCPNNAPANCSEGPKWSANDPIFFLHHAMVDKVWYDWQHRHRRNYWAFRGGSVAYDNTTQYPNGGAPWMHLNSTIPTDGMWPEWTVHQVMNTTGGTLCYVYE